MAKRSTKKGDREPIVIHESESESSEAGDDDDEEEEGGEDDAEYEVEEILNWKMGDKGVRSGWMDGWMDDWMEYNI